MRYAISLTVEADKQPSPAAVCQNLKCPNTVGSVVSIKVTPQETSSEAPWPAHQQSEALYLGGFKSASWHRVARIRWDHNTDRVLVEWLEGPLHGQRTSVPRSDLRLPRPPA